MSGKVIKLVPTMSGGARPIKRRMVEGEGFWTTREEEGQGAFLVVRLKSGRELRRKGWPWLQLCLRNVLGENNKVEKATLMKDGGLLIKTGNKKQAEKFLRAKFFDSEEAVVELHPHLNKSRGTIYAWDLIDLGEEEIRDWLQQYGVSEVKRVNRRVGGREKGTPF